VTVPPQQNLWVSSGFGRRPGYSPGGSIPSRAPSGLYWTGWKPSGA